ncbi:subtilisin-like protein [Metschnikowia bicuspidata var. bicuspidata NRRL YB-4993]|uniref:Subtilisin-like protein n=1 Tax=Metschnikowia bicuspidata var. bicuspidata NRRL YB-4993 TaxID=869754 RepID=A0A1A0H769_9ASCO|nr:subtilisin-like protein [Metschnikowia bicuspidata var. bicuspidata NRRL YB-4993]OBA19748.1 subtilisin-like protein [Metschnikowia bicuspidata var. bicuspidata NRRL YB-4993]
MSQLCEWLLTFLGHSKSIIRHSLSPLLACSSALLIPHLNNMGNLEHIFSLKENKDTPGETPHEPISPKPAPKLAAPICGGSNVVPQLYIVVLKHGFEDSAYDSHNEWVNDHLSAMAKRDVISDLRDEAFNLVEKALKFVSIPSFRGYVGYVPPALLEILRTNHMVDFIEQDSIMHINEFDTQSDAPWGLARVSLRELSQPAATEYLYDDEGGKGVTAYVIDTGIKVAHPDFEGRAVWGDAVAFPKVRIDAHGHGSHVAGTIGGKTYGIAKNVDLVAVGVMNLLGSGTTSDIIKGIEFVVKDHQAKVDAKQKGYKGATINMSIGGGASEALDLAVNAATSAGLHVAVAAGNENQDACSVSPARASGPITVGATDNSDQKAEFSNWGKCVDIQAPGVDITSVGIWLETQTMSGTSMAAPHVTGLLSYLLSLQPELDSEFSSKNLVTPAELKRRFLKFGTRNVVSGLDRESPNILAYNGAGQDLSEFWKF